MPRQALITTDKFGPAMSKLTVSEQMFVCNLFTSYKSITKAAELAGYTAETRNALHVKAHRLLRNSDVAAAVKEESKRRTTFLLPKAQRALEAMVENPQHTDHFKAVKLVRDDGGVTAAVERVLKVSIEVSQPEKLEAIKQFAINHGLDPKKLLGFNPDAVDAEFEEVDPDEEDRALGII